MLFLIIFLGLISTSLGSALVFFLSGDLSEKKETLFLGFASGVMIAASIWSLLIPALEYSESLGKLSFLPPSIGFLLGALFLVLIDHIVPHLHLNGDEEGPQTRLGRNTRLFLAMTIHNFPEGLGVGFALGAALSDGGSYSPALTLALAMAIQNMPEGAAISLPMRKENGKLKAFLFGSLSAVVEPISALLGMMLSSLFLGLSPYMLSFSAGAMIFVVAEDLIPESKMEEHPHQGALALIFGFLVMMILDVMLA